MNRPIKFKIRKHKPNINSKLRAVCGELEAGIPCGGLIPCRFHPNSNKRIIEEIPRRRQRQ